MCPGCGLTVEAFDALLHTERQAAIEERDAYWKAQEMGASHDCHAHAEEAARLAKEEVFKDLMRYRRSDAVIEIVPSQVEKLASQHNITL